MRHFYMSVVERRETYAGDFDTHPYETAWAGEAIFFLRVEEIAEGSTVTARVQISADGLRWIDEGTEFVPQENAGDSFVKVKNFGGWLRLRGTVTGPNPSAQLTVQLALKE